MWIYPLYLDKWMRAIYVGGTWIWIAIIVRWCQTFYNEQLSKW